MYIYVYVYIYVCIYIRVCVFVYTCMCFSYVYISIYVFVCVCVSLRIHNLSCVNASRTPQLLQNQKIQHMHTVCISKIFMTHGHKSAPPCRHTLSGRSGIYIRIYMYIYEYTHIKIQT